MLNHPSRSTRSRWRYARSTYPLPNTLMPARRKYGSTAASAVSGITTAAPGRMNACFPNFHSASAMITTTTGASHQSMSRVATASAGACVSAISPQTITTLGSTKPSPAASPPRQPPWAWPM